MMHLLCILTSRAIVIAVKYGYYSREHYFILKTCRLNQAIAVFDLIQFAIHDTNINSIEARLNFEMELMNIDPRTFHFDVYPNREDLEYCRQIERLKDKNLLINSYRQAKVAGTTRKKAQAEVGEEVVELTTYQKYAKIFGKQISPLKKQLVEQFHLFYNAEESTSVDGKCVTIDIILKNKNKFMGL